MTAPEEDTAPSPGEERLLELLEPSFSIHNDDQVVLLLGSGFTAAAIPGVRGVLEIADRYAEGRNDDGALANALRQARTELGRAADIDVYRAYRRVFTDWESIGAFDVIAQQAVLGAYTAPDPMESPLATHGLWQRVGLAMGEAVENDRFSWQLPRGVQAAGHLLTQEAATFDHRVVTTNFDPLLEIAVREAGGRAVSLPLDAHGEYGMPVGAAGAVRVYHLHGFWRPTWNVEGPPLLADPALLTGDGRELSEATARLIRGYTICVLGSSDWAGTLATAIRLVAARQQGHVRVLWGLRDADADRAAERSRWLSEVVGAPVTCLPGVESDRFFPLLAERVGVTVPPRATGLRHRVRHHSWERQLVSQPDTLPPDDVPGLLVQLERRFGWVTQHLGEGSPARMLWPVRLRARASVIHMVQAFVAGALARRGVELLVCLDDVGLPDSSAAESFRADLDRWIDHTGPGADRRFMRLTDFVDDTQRRGREPTPEAMLRPTDPWSVARVFYGKQNPSLYSVLAAVKAVPNITTWDGLEKNAWPIVQSVQRSDANRLLTPLTLWPLLNHLLLESPATALMTLGGRDEAILWAQWRQTFGPGVGHLYNPHIKSLRHDAHMLSWSSRDQLTKHLHRTPELPGWDAEGGYVPWLFQNALLLPRYLNHEPVPETADSTLDSWAAFVAAIQDGEPALDVLAEGVTDLYLNEQDRRR